MVDTYGTYQSWTFVWMKLLERFQLQKRKVINRVHQTNRFTHIYYCGLVYVLLIHLIASQILYLALQIPCCRLTGNRIGDELCLHLIYVKYGKFTF